jgi:HAD superfamily hydrolase (TIGR01509 family)
MTSTPVDSSLQSTRKTALVLTGARPRAVLFDYDGVLVASEPIHLSAWMQLLDELGLPKSKDLIRSMTGKTAPEILRQIFQKHRPEKVLSQDELNVMAQRKNQFYIAAAHQELFTYPGVHEGLEWLKSQNILMAVVSNGRRAELLKTMEQLKLTPYFKEIISRDDSQLPKPNPLPYLMGAASLGLEVEDCLAIEDSPPGLEAALRAQIPGAAVTTNFSAQTLENPVLGLPHLKPHWIGPSIQEFFAWLKTLSK